VKFMNHFKGGSQSVEVWKLLPYRLHTEQHVNYYKFDFFCISRPRIIRLYYLCLLVQIVPFKTQPKTSHVL
jgi:hypothetical protein